MNILHCINIKLQFLYKIHINGCFPYDGKLNLNSLEKKTRAVKLQEKIDANDKIGFREGKVRAILLFKYIK